MNFTQSEENYIKAIFALSDGTDLGVSTNLLAERMLTKPSSATDMLKKLKEKNLIEYKKYKGCSLTNEGRDVALQILRKHRLWEVFLVQKLNFGWEEVHEVAEQLEHIRSKKLIDKLDALLDYPKFDPHGEPIPDASGKMEAHKKCVLLSELNAGEHGVVVGVEDGSTDFFTFLKHNNIELGVDVILQEVFNYDKSVRILLKNKEVNISHAIASKILIQTIES